MILFKKFLDHHKNRVFLSLKFKKIVFLLSVCPWAKNTLFACPLSMSFQTEISWTCPFVPQPNIRLRDIPSYRMAFTGFPKYQKRAESAWFLSRVSVCFWF
jgi:hypothetical protein